MTINNNKNEYNFGKLNTAELLDTTVDIYKKSFVSNLGFSMATGIISYIILLIGTLIIGGIVFASYVASDMSLITIIFIIIGAVALVGIGCCLVAISTSGAVIFSKQVILTGKSDFSAAFKRCFKSFPSLASALFLEFIIFLPIFSILTLIYVYFISSGFTSFQIETSITIDQFAIYSIIYFLLTFIIFSFLYVKFTPLASVCILEKKRFLTAVKRSFELTKGSYWKIFGTLLLNWLVIYFLTYALMLIATGIGSLFSYILGFGVNSESIVLIASFSSNIVSPIITLAIAPIGNIIYTVIYYNQRIKNDGYDVVIEIEKLTIKHRQKIHTNKKRETIPIIISDKA